MDNMCRWYYAAHHGIDISLEHDKIIKDREYVELTKCPICGKSLNDVTYKQLTFWEMEKVKHVITNNNTRF